MIDEFAPPATVRTIGGDDWPVSEASPDVQRMTAGACAMAGIDPERCYVLAVHLSEIAVWVDVAVPTDRRSADSIPDVKGPGPHDWSILYRRFRG
jgi:hypothetical protein